MSDEFVMDFGGNDDGYSSDVDNLVLNLDSVDENSGGFEALPPGVYNCIVENVEYGNSKKSNNPMITWTFKVVDEQYENRLLFYHTVLTQDIGVANLKKTLIRVCPDVDMSQFKPRDFADNGDALGLPCRVKVKIKPYNGEKRNSVTEVLAPAAAEGSFLG